MVEKEVTPDGLKKLDVSYRNALKQIRANKEKQGETLRDEDTDVGIELRAKSFISQFKIKPLAIMKEISETYKAIEEKKITEKEGVEKFNTIIHKQSRSYLKTIARDVGRETEKETLFSLSTYKNELEPKRETISRKTGILGNHLFKLWQSKKDSKNILTIDNLSELAREMQTSPQELKLYLICLGGYQYPIIRIEYDEILKKRVLRTGSDKLFHIDFISDLKEKQDNIEKIGTYYSNFVKNRDILRVEIRPSDNFINDMQNEGKGNFVFASANFVQYCLEMTDLTYKIFCFTSSNKPTQKISFEKFVRNLNLERQLKRKGKPITLKEIITSGQDLINNGHFKYFNYNKERDMFEWKYTNKIIKHKDLLEPKKMEIPENTEKEKAEREKDRINETIKTKRTLKEKQIRFKWNNLMPEEQEKLKDQAMDSYIKQGTKPEVIMETAIISRAMELMMEKIDK